MNWFAEWFQSALDSYKPSDARPRHAWRSFPVSIRARLLQAERRPTPHHIRGAFRFNPRSTLTSRATYRPLRWIRSHWFQSALDSYKPSDTKPPTMPTSSGMFQSALDSYKPSDLIGTYIADKRKLFQSALDSYKPSDMDPVTRGGAGNGFNPRSTLTSRATLSMFFFRQPRMFQSALDSYKPSDPEVVVLSVAVLTFQSALDSYKPSDMVSRCLVLVRVRFNPRSTLTSRATAMPLQ